MSFCEISSELQDNLRDATVYGTNELLQLAQLLRMGAVTARQIASLREFDSKEILRLADKAEEMAGELEMIVSRSAAPQQHS